MNVLHFLATGGTGGIESLIREYSENTELNNYYVIFWGSGVNSDYMKNKGKNIIELPYGKKRVLATIKALKKLVKTNEIDVIVTHHAAPAMWFYMVLLKNSFPKLRTYIYAHANLKDILRKEKIQSIAGEAIFKTAFRKCDNVIAISNSVKNSFAQYGYKTDKIKVIYNGVDCKKFIPVYEKKDDVVRITYVGRLIKQKGVDRLIKAVALLDKKLNFVCDIVGDGAARQEFEELACQLGVNDRITFHGSRSDVPTFLPKQTVFVHPAMWEEGFGIAVVEAMAAGLVAVAYNKGALSEIIDNNVNGFIVDEETPQALSEKLAYIIENYNTAEIADLRKAAVEKAQKFDLSIFTNELDDLLEGEEA